MQSDCEELLQQILGYVLIRDKRESLIIFHGPASSGKTTLATFIQFTLNNCYQNDVCRYYHRVTEKVQDHIKLIFVECDGISQAEIIFHSSLIPKTCQIIFITNSLSSMSSELPVIHLPFRYQFVERPFLENHRPCNPRILETLHPSFNEFHIWIVKGMHKLIISTWLKNPVIEVEEKKNEFEIAGMLN
jgi:hypothetical protein